MKELTIEQKAKAYDEAKLRMSRAFNSNRCTIGFMNEIFPELVESEDEKIRRELLAHCKDKAEKYSNDPKYKNINAWIAWLEKQDNKSTNIDIESMVSLYKQRLKSQGAMENSPLLNMYLSAFRHGIENALVEVNLKLCEQNLTNKVESKFKVGDWVVFKNKHQSIYQVEKIENGYYILRHTHGGTFRVCVLHDEDLRFWTIQDAKDGDVLVSQYNKPFIYNGNYNSVRIGAYCGISVDDMFIVAIGKCNWTDNVNIHPATKEQCDTLSAKMKEAGCEWNAELKEVRMLSTLTDIDDDTIRVIDVYNIK